MVGCVAVGDVAGGGEHLAEGVEHDVDLAVERFLGGNGGLEVLVVDDRLDAVRARSVVVGVAFEDQLRLDW